VAAIWAFALVDCPGDFVTALPSLTVAAPLVPYA
jgi:hypothetical protein